MADNSRMEWTDATWNPVRGCVKLSPGCKHCYAETFAARLPNVWWGVSVEDRRYGLPRVQHLRAAPTRTRFLSVEPLLEEAEALAAPWLAQPALALGA